MRKHSGWYKNYLLFAQKVQPHIFDKETVAVFNFLANKSINARIVDQLRGFSMQHARFSTRAPLTNIEGVQNNYIPALYPTHLGMSIFFNLNLLRSLALRQYKIRRMLRGYPIRGQRR